MNMTLDELIKRVRSYTRDFTGSIFRNADVVDYINEGIDRCKSVPALRKMAQLAGGNQYPILLPQQYHHILALYSASRCFGQDERHYQATNYMNEFEHKLSELKTAIENGEIIIVDDNGKPVPSDVLDVDYVEDVYFSKRHQRKPY